MISIKPFEIHVYYGSSFYPEEKWVVKGFEELYGMFPSREAALQRAREIARGFLFPQYIWVHPFSKTDPKRRLIVTR